MKVHAITKQAAVAIIFLALLCASCASVQPLTSTDHQFAQDEDEQKLISESAKFSSELRSKGLIFQDEQVNAYLREVANRLIPRTATGNATFNFQVLRDPVVNAFALPNGDIYLTVGLLARLENEAQLAHVLSHEVAHVVQRHGLQQLLERKASIIAAHIADIALFGTSIAYLPFIASIASYSREQEKEADLMALSYMSAAGYPLDGAYQLFTLIQEVKNVESIKGSIFASHPDNKLRAQYTKDYIVSQHLPPNADGDEGAQRYLLIRAELVVENIQLKLNIKQYQLAIEAADRALVQQPAVPWLHYYRGEAMRLMAEDPEGAARESSWINGTNNNARLVESFRQQQDALYLSAKDAYQQALASEPGFAFAHRGLGLVANAQGDSKGAREALTFYLTNGRNISDRLYITKILGGLNTP